MDLDYLKLYLIGNFSGSQTKGVMPIFISILITLMSYLYREFAHLSWQESVAQLHELMHLFRHKYLVVLEGKRSDIYNLNFESNHVYSNYCNSFKALMHFLVSHPQFKSQLSQLEIVVQDASFDMSESGGLGGLDIDVFIPLQHIPICINTEMGLYAKIKVSNEKTTHSSHNGAIHSIYADNKYIRIELFSYTTPTFVINEYVTNITEQYLKTVETARFNKQFVYTISLKKDCEDSERWKETVFTSTKTFNNLFFSQKKKVLEKLDFFLNNKAWYEKLGIPYTIGFALHGPPGTGKTSFIKALANYTGRHIVCLSMKHIKTREQLETMFFEDTYNSKNRSGSIGFDKKIIVIEDIDCIGKIVFDRKLQAAKRKKYTIGNDDEDSENTDSEQSTANAIAKSLKTLAKPKSDKIKNVDEITLDDILNMWDGVRESSGRILCVSSNEYEKLDEALKRPGRMDVSISLMESEKSEISELFEYVFNEKMSYEMECKRVSMAELTNVLKGGITKEEFLEYLRPIETSLNASLNPSLNASLNSP